MKWSYLLLIICLVSCSSPQPKISCPGKGLSQLSEGIAAYNRGEMPVAFSLLKAAADCGNSDAQVNLGYMYARGQGAIADQAQALKLYEMYAASGNGEGMNALGYKYEFGTGVPVDLNIAIGWYCKAISLGNPRALNNLAVLYETGTGVPRDVATARDLWQQSAERGHLTAVYNLGRSYIDGPGELNLQLGIQLEIKAAREGSRPAQELLRRRGYSEPLPPVASGPEKMVLQSPDLLPGHAPVCGS